MVTPRLSLLRVAVLFGVTANLCLIIVRVLLYRPLLSMPGAVGFVVEPVLALVGCGSFALLAASGKSLKREAALWAATFWGVLGGALLIVHMGLENFGSRIGENSRNTLAFMFATFLLWCAAGYTAARSTASRSVGLLAGCWSGVVSVLIAVSFGLSLMFFNVPPLSYVSTWDEFKRSGWSDAHAFSIANSLEAAFTHLLAGMIVGVIFGAIGAGVAKALPVAKRA
jgi:hypothetical protein